MELDEYRAANLANWNDRVPIHWDSEATKFGITLTIRNT